MLAHFDWAIYGFNSGHFLLTIKEHGYPFHVVLACDPFVNGRALFWELTLCFHIHSSAASLLDHIQASGITSKLTGYLIHSHCYYSSKPTKRFWELQCHIVVQLRIIQSLSIVVAFIHPAHDNQAISTMFINGLWRDGWLVTNTVVSFPDYSIAVSGLTCLLLCMHTNSKTNCKPIKLCSPPPIPTRPIARYIWAPLNMPEHAVSYGNGDPSFNLHAVNDTGLPPMKACPPSDTQQSLVTLGVRISYNLHRKHDNPSILPGISIVNVDGLCPEFDAHKNINLFGHHFGIKFIYDGHTYVRAIFAIQICISCFHLTNNLT
jgi:hypothetical protein